MLFTKWFKSKENTPDGLVEKLLQEILDQAGFSLSFNLEVNKDAKGEIFIDLFGEDEQMLIAKEGRLLLAFQTYLNRVIQHCFFDEGDLAPFVRLDSGSYFKQKEQKLLNLAKKLKTKALQTGQPVYFKSLPPFQRRKVHQFLSRDKEVQTVSMGEGFYKNICITPNLKRSASHQQ